MPQKYVVVVDRRSDWRWDAGPCQITTVTEYLSGGAAPTGRPLRIINLCRRYSYLSAGYYCSLLAEARGDIPMPTAADMADLTKKSLYSFVIPQVEEAVAGGLRGERAEDLHGRASRRLYVFFGQPHDATFKQAAALLFETFRYPLMVVTLATREERWHVESIRPLGLSRIRGPLDAFFQESFTRYTRGYRRPRRSPPPALYDLAILHDPEEHLPPSDPAALDRFVRAGERLRVEVELIRRRDLSRLPEFDALFIREYTGLNRPSFLFARRAAAEGIPVIDDPRSIIRCTNKIYLRELLRTNGLPAPTSVILDRARFGRAEAAAAAGTVGLPAVLKVPDGAFSIGVRKVESVADLEAVAQDLFRSTRLVLCQEFVPTRFDWRIGILAGEPLFACQYRMARRHWQILKHGDDGSVEEGGFRTVPLDAVPEAVLRTAVTAASLIGDGLYGLDLKETARGPLVIEINDNPNIDHGVEDRVLGRALYERILQDFIRRIRASRTV